MMILNLDTLAPICDHTFLTPVEAYRGQGNAIELRREAFNAFLAEALALPVQPYTICVPTGDVRPVKQALEAKERAPKICSIAGFPDGSWISTEQKVVEALTGISLGAHEIDMVLHWRALKDGDLAKVRKDLFEVCQTVHGEGALLKVILEAEALTDDEVVQACALCEEVGADFVKSSTGFGPGGATPRAMRLMVANFSRGVKMSGGVKKENVDALIKATGMSAPFDPLRLRIGESGLLT